jgi:DNA topoisomerase-2
MFGKKIVNFVSDPLIHVNMNKIFHKLYANDRKTWLSEYDPTTCPRIPDGPSVQMSISDFLNNEVIKFSINDCTRSIPSIIDGLKESQRKILYSCFKRGLDYNSKELKVAQLAGYVAEHTNYHHGEQNLCETITKMSVSYVGGNNIPLLSRGGAMGTRLSGGKDAANARYIFTKLDYLTRDLFNEADDVLLERNLDDGDYVEPRFYVPIIPMVLVNGISGAIGTGWSSNIPAYNPLELCQMIRVWLKNKTIEDANIKPWYRGFKGEIEEDVANARYVTRGLVQTVNSKKVITELPVGVWTNDYKDMLDGMVENKILKKVYNYITTTTVHFELVENDTPIDDKILKLHSYLSTNNIVLFDHTGKITKYTGVNEVLNEYCGVRFKYYTLRKKNRIQCLMDKLVVHRNKKRFIEDVIADRLVLFKRPTQEIHSEMSRMLYDRVADSFDYLLSLPIKSFTLERIVD